MIRRDSAPGDLKGHPDRFAAGRVDHLLRHVTDDTDVLVGQVGMLTGRISDRVDVSARDVERRPVRNEARHRTERSLRDHYRVIGIDGSQFRPGTGESSRGDPAPRRFVDPLIGAQSRVRLQPVGDSHQQLLGD